MSSYRDFEVAKFKVVKVPCISHIKTSQYAPTFPMTSLDFWTWDFGSHVYNILGCPELFQDLFGSLDLVMGQLGKSSEVLPIFLDNPGIFGLSFHTTSYKYKF